MSTCISIVVVLLVVLSTTLISGLLYLSLSKSLSAEFAARVKAKSGELNLLLKNRLNRVENRLRELTLDNTVRVTLMLGADQQLQEHFSAVYGSDRATHFFIGRVDLKKIFNASGLAMAPERIVSLLKSSALKGRLAVDPSDGLMFSSALPVFRQKEMIGVAGCIYYMYQDETLTGFFTTGKNGRLINVTDQKAIDVFAGRPVQIGLLPDPENQTDPLGYMRVDGQIVAAVANPDYPGLLYVTSMGCLQKAKLRVLKVLVFPVIGVLFLATVISLLLSRKLGLPLQRLAGMALQVAQGRRELVRRTGKCHIIEIEHLTTSLNTMLANLRQAEELRRYQELFDGVADPVFIFDFCGRIIEANQIATDHFDYSRSAFLKMGMTDIIPEHRRKNMSSVLQDLAQTNDQVFFETSILTAKGRKVLVECHARKIVFRQQQVVLSVVRDITDRKEAEKNLKASEERYRTIVEHSHDGIIIIDENHGLIYVNDEFRRITGRCREELLGADFRRLLDEASKEIVSERYQRRQKGEEAPSRYEFNIIHKNGNIRRVEISATVIRDSGGRVRTIAQMLDITELKRAEEALKASEERYRTILDSSDIGYFEIDLSGNIDFCNDALSAMLDYPRQDLIGMSFQDLTDEATAGMLIKAYRRILFSGQPCKALEHQVYNRNADARTVETSVYLITNNDQRPVGFRGLARDVTEQRDIEMRLQRAQKMESIGTLAGGVAHDLNNILSGIVGYPDLMLLNLPVDSPLRKPILAIQKTGEKAAAIVQDLLTLARRGVTVKEPTNLNAIVSEYVSSPECANLRSIHPGVTIELDLDPELADIAGSPFHLSETVMNLVGNAAEAMPDGGTITISTQNQLIDHAMGYYDRIKEGPCAVLKVQDTGSGIAAEDLGRIFEPFFTKKVMGRSGTGLGMAVVWGTVTDHDGYIDVQSAIGIGTVFTLYFPAPNTLPTIKVSLSPKFLDYMGSGESILVIDDVAEQREIACAMLAQLGYTAHSVCSGEKALVHLQQYPADLIILDMIMEPGMDGLETFKRIIQLYPHQKAVIASGFSETVYVKQAQQLGAGQYIRKPYTLNKLGLAIKNELACGNTGNF